MIIFIGFILYIYIYLFNSYKETRMENKFSKTQKNEKGNVVKFWKQDHFYKMLKFIKIF